MEKRFIPENVMSNKRIFFLRKRNFIEAIIEILVCIVILSRINFTIPVRWIFLISLSVLILVANYVGIHDIAPFKALSEVFKYNRNTKKIYSYRRFGNGELRHKEAAVVEGKFDGVRQKRKKQLIEKFVGR